MFEPIAALRKIAEDLRTLPSQEKYLQDLVAAQDSLLSEAGSITQFAWPRFAFSQSFSEATLSLFDSMHDCIDSFCDEPPAWVAVVHCLADMLGYPPDYTLLRSEDRECRSSVVVRGRRVADLVIELVERAESTIAEPAENRALSTADEISRDELLEMLKIKTSTLSTRIKKSGFPKPSRTEGKKQWFNVHEVDQWRESERNKHS